LRIAVVRQSEHGIHEHAVRVAALSPVRCWLAIRIREDQPGQISQPFVQASRLPGSFEQRSSAVTSRGRIGVLQ
jgi:hypothetical protein